MFKSTSPFLLPVYRRDRRFLGRSRRSTASVPLRRGITLLRRPLRRREGGGSPSPACTYGRVGWGSRRRLLGGGGAGGGWFGVGAVFSGGGVPRDSSSPRATCRRSRPGVVLELVCLPPDLRRRRIRRLEFRPRCGSRTPQCLNLMRSYLFNIWPALSLVLESCYIGCF